jgi:competence protein ComEC
MSDTKQAQPFSGGFGLSHKGSGPLAQLWPLRQNPPQWLSYAVATPSRGSLSLFGPWVFCAGVAAYFYPVDEPLYFLPVLAIIACLLLGIFAKTVLKLQSVWPIFVLALIGAFWTGWGSAQWRTHYRAAPKLTDYSKVYKGQGLVLAVDKERGKRARYLIEPSRLGRLDDAQMPKRIRVSSFIKDAEPGDRVGFTAALQAPSAAYFPGAYNFQRAAWFARIGGTGFSYGHIRPLASDAKGNTHFTLGLAKIRRAIALRIRNDLTGQKGAVAAALVTGDRSTITPQTAENLRIAGLAHMLAISGLHMGLVAGLVFGAGSMMLAAVPAIGRRYDARKPAALLGLMVASGYLLLSGSSAPTERAFVMTAVVLSAVLFDRRALSLRTISLAALIVAALSPESVISPGFQMSFAAALSLIAFYEWLGNRRHILPKATRLTPGMIGLRIGAILGALALTSLIAGLATGPFAAFYFHRTALYGLAANIAAMPVFTFIVMPSLLAGTLLDSVGAGAPFFALAGWGLDIILSIAGFVSQLNGAMARVPAGNVEALALIAVGIVLLCLMRQTRRLWGVMAIIAGLLVWSGYRQPDGVLTRTSGLLRNAINGKEIIIGYGDITRFDLQQFAQAAALDDESTLNIKKARKVIPCDVSGCVLTLPDGRRLAINRKLDHLSEDCQLADLVITTTRPARRNAANCPSAKLIETPKTQGGAALLYLNNPVTVKPLPIRNRLWSTKQSQ